MICLKIRTFVVSATTVTIPDSVTVMLWFAWKFVPLWYQQQQRNLTSIQGNRCDLLENSYLCGISNNRVRCLSLPDAVVICLKIRTFVVSATTCIRIKFKKNMLWFAWKFVPLWYQQQPLKKCVNASLVVICLKIRTFVVSATTRAYFWIPFTTLWFAWKFVPLWYQQQLKLLIPVFSFGCDLLENSYLCGISNNV